MFVQYFLVLLYKIFLFPNKSVGINLFTVVCINNVVLEFVLHIQILKINVFCITLWNNFSFVKQYFDIMLYISNYL